jgi:radical SAM superfamily enzyme YgiQ (UPF0313 family)
VESGNQRVLDLIQKDLTPEEVLRACRKLIPYPITPVFLFMMGLPTETPAEIGQSIRLARQVLSVTPRASKSFNIYMPYPGTALYRRVVESGFKEPRRLEDWAPLNYRYIHREAPWISKETKRLIAALDFPLMFMGKGHFYKKTHPLVVWLAKLYHPLAEYRITHLESRLPIETFMLKRMGLFGRED